MPLHTANGVHLSTGEEIAQIATGSLAKVTAPLVVERDGEHGEVERYNFITWLVSINEGQVATSRVLEHAGRELDLQTGVGGADSGADPVQLQPSDTVHAQAMYTREGGGGGGKARTIRVITVINGVVSEQVAIASVTGGDHSGATVVQRVDDPVTITLRLEMFRPGQGGATPFNRLIPMGGEAVTTHTFDVNGLSTPSLSDRLSRPVKVDPWLYFAIYEFDAHQLDEILKLEPHLF